MTVTVGFEERRWFVLERPRRDTNGGSETEVMSMCVFFLSIVSDFFAPKIFGAKAELRREEHPARVAVQEQLARQTCPPSG